LTEVDIVPTCKRLQELRVSLGYKKPGDFADEIGVKYTTYLNYEKKTAPPAELLVLIGEKFTRDVNLNWLLTGQGPKLFLGHMKPGAGAVFGPGRDEETPEMDPDNIDLIRMAIDVLQAGHPTYTLALQQNIRAFYRALLNDPEKAAGDPAKKRCGVIER